MASPEIRGCSGNGVFLVGKFEKFNRYVFIRIFAPLLFVLIFGWVRGMRSCNVTPWSVEFYCICLVKYIFLMNIVFSFFSKY